MIKLHDKNFELFIPHEQIMAGVNAIATRLNADYGTNGGDYGAAAVDPDATGIAEEADSATAAPPIFVGVLNGSFMVMAALVQQINFMCEMSFVKLVSYVGTASSGAVSELIGLGCDVCGRRVVVVEDIVETGLSTSFLVDKLLAEGAADVQIATLFLKPTIYTGTYPVKYVGISMAAEFIVGFGLDYNGLGRNFRDIYKVVKGDLAGSANEEGKR